MQERVERSVIGQLLHLQPGVGTTSGTYADNTDLDTRVDIGLKW